MAGRKAKGRRRATRPSTSRSSRASTRCASGPACTSGRPGRPACTTSCGRSSTTRSTRRWPGYCTRIDVTLLADGGVPCRRQRPRHPGRRAPAVQGQVGGRDRDDHAARGRQVRRRRLQGLRRAARRRRVGRERAVARSSCSRSTATARRTARSTRPRRRAVAPCKPGVPQGPLKKVAGVEARAHRHDGHVLARPRRVRGDRVPRRDRDRAAAGDGVPQPWPRDRVPRRAAGPQAAARRSRTTPASSTSSRHLNRAKEPLFKDVGFVHRPRAPRARSRSRGSGTPATTRVCTRTPTASRPPKAGCTPRASSGRSPRRSTATPRPATS